MAATLYKCRMKKRAAIYIDMDDVITNTHQLLLHVLEREFGKKMSYSQITDFDLQRSFDLTDREYEHFFECVHDPEVMIRQAPVKGAKEVIQTWKDRGHTISILTGRPAVSRDVSITWLDRHGFLYDSFTIVNKYGRDASNGNGAISLESLLKKSFDLAVEDSGKMAKFLSERMGVRVALLDRPWNRDESFNHRVRRCAGWPEVETCFKTLREIPDSFPAR